MLEQQRTAYRDFLTEVDELYRSDARRLWRSLFTHTRSATVADDALAEAFAQVLRRGHDVRDPQKWVWRAAFRIAAGDLQLQRRAQNEVFGEVVYLDPNNNSEDDTDIAEALRTLSDMQRRAVVLHYYAGYRAAEVAHLTGSTEAAVRVHLMRARRRLRPLLAPNAIVRSHSKD